MRCAALLLAIFWSVPARAQCTEAPEGSASRSVSEVPYDVPRAADCRPPASAPATEPGQGWTASRESDFRSSFIGAGVVGISLGGILLVTGATLAICAASSDSGSFCRSARAPVLITGAAVSALGLGALAIGTWVVPERSEQGRAGLAAGVDLRLAWSFAR
jgi:hypothetical protein